MSSSLVTSAASTAPASWARMYTAAVETLICFRASMAVVTAGLKWAPEASASPWIRMNSAKVCTVPITLKSTNGSGSAAVGAMA